MTADPTELGRLGAQEAQPSSATVVAGRHAKESPGPQPLTAEELAAIEADLALADPLDRECEELRAIAGLLATVEALQAQVAELTEAREDDAAEACQITYEMGVSLQAKLRAAEAKVAELGVALAEVMDERSHRVWTA